ncbi:MAG: nitroreductase family protein [Burkholderiales bacterium]|nr:nitroreductase family protein [Burkholderiales bacterium]MDQ3195861.1 nitroreductase family protein [Pseudomonadota bacterium]
MSADRASDKTASTAVAIDALIARRWSPRAFDPAKPVSHAQLIALFEAARWAPSCFGDEPWRYIAWDRRDEAGWRKAFDCLSPGNQQWVKNAPLLIASIAGSEFSQSGKPNRWAQHDTGAASENLVLQAASLGLAAHQMGGFDKEKLIAAFGIPNGFMPMAMIAIGYQASADLLSPDYQARELAARTRKPLGEKFFEGEWGAPVTPPALHD